MNEVILTATRQFQSIVLIELVIKFDWLLAQSIPMEARKSRKLPNDARARVLSVVITLVAGGVFGTMLAVGWGQNFRPRSLSVDRRGIIHRVALPDGVKTRDDVRDFDVELTPADDFARISINNYWPMSTESPSGKNEVRRNHGMGRLGKTLHLRPGRNFLVYELENLGSYCSGAFRLYINAQPVVGLPGGVPVNPHEIRSLVGDANASFDNAICSRRIVEIDLGVGAEPGPRFQELFAFW
jgi:hypothetical protein